VWAVLFGVPLTLRIPLDPLASSYRWDEGALAALALIVRWRQRSGAHRAKR
jgi:hypothetical protein